MNEIPTPPIVLEAWRATGDGRRILGSEESSARVSTNQVLRLRLDVGPPIFAKLSSYGSFFQFREDHSRIHAWCQLLRGTRYDGFLADVLTTDDDQVFTYYDGENWVIFYESVALGEKLPRILDDAMIENLGTELALFHAESLRDSTALSPSSKTLKSDAMLLLALLEIDQWVREAHLTAEDARFLTAQCETFLTNVERLGYDKRRLHPVLIDWNLGNFSVKRTESGRFQLYSRWDYDWFRMEPRTLDFYFLSRVVSAIGDKTDFSYYPDTLLEPRFRRFLTSYHAVNPLASEEILFLREAYRFFLLNYVIKDGEHFFLPSYCRRLKREAVAIHLPRVDDLDLDSLAAMF